MTIASASQGGINTITINHPPVNALAAKQWMELAAALGTAGRDAGVRAVIIRAEGRGFCAGVDIKELAAGGPDAMIAINRACATAFAAVYDCPVPVIVAVHGFCLGGGVGLAGNADVIIASADATFGLPEIDRGALGAATHLSRLVPHHRMRAMYYLAETATAQELHAYGSVYEVVELDKLDNAANEVAQRIAAKDGAILRLAKEAINGIDPVDVKRSYRYEQGFTFEHTLSPTANEAREAFLQNKRNG
ncbi:MAG: enoyl-CoA hydratase family protein [Chloroflexi bacterium]|nr:enoyl-CoA hydratase family protein [Chloroflexota bacterium]